MVAIRLSALALLLSNAWMALGQADAIPDVDEKVQDPSTSPNLKLKISATFPQSEIFGIKLVNYHPTEALVSVKNEETSPVSLAFIGGSLLTPVGVPGAPSPPQILRNLTTTRYGSEIQAGQAESFSYSFVNEMHPQDLTLALTAVIQDQKGAVYTYQFFNQTVSVVEAPSSIFDPQVIFLYLILAAAFGGTCYFIYNTWITTFFPQKRGKGKGGERAKKSSGGSKKVDPAEQVSVVGADGPAVTSGAQGYDQSWIPAHHLQRPEAKRVASGSRSRPKSKQGPVSP
ncbi:Translocon-associated protein (TRAP) alpha subunit-like protein [Elsinoe fawcettii]|nr:Translocon-associated protein (TRAP) alpha subunit-like protein [Elsinoe fawcettii]